MPGKKGSQDVGNLHPGVSGFSSNLYKDEQNGNVQNILLDSNFTFKDGVRKVTEALAKKIPFEKIDIDHLKLNNAQQKD